jgi:hypothetical protein
MMKLNKSMFWINLIAIFCLATGAQAQKDSFYVLDQGEKGEAASFHTVLRCDGEVSRVIDVADESVHTTAAIFGTSPGGGEGGQFDKTPVLTVDKVRIDDGSCLNAHLSAIVGSAQTYGVAPLALFQVTLTSVDGSIGPRHMVGHYETPYGIASPAVALEAENDVDMLGANFFQRFGFGKHDVPPGTYRVDVWWAGAPPFTAGGAIGAAFVLKLYFR